MNEIARVMHVLNQKPIAFYRVHAEIMGSITGGLALSQILYWFTAGKKQPRKIYKTDAELQKETALSTGEMRSVKKKLKSLSFITVSREGVPAKTYYEVHWDKYYSSLAEITKQDCDDEELDNTDEQDTSNQPSQISEIHGTITETTQRLPENTSSVATEVDDEASDEKEISETMTMAIVVGDYLVQKLSESIETYKPPTPAKMQGWYRDIDRAIGLDGRTQEQLIRMVDWIHDGNGTFWTDKIMSGKKLREHFDKLWHQMSTSTPKVNMRQRALEDFGLGKVFYKYKEVSTDRTVSVCLYGNYGSLYDYNGSKYIAKEVADKLWKHIEKDYEQILAAFKGGLSTKLSA